MEGEKIMVTRSGFNKIRESSDWFTRMQKFITYFWSLLLMLQKHLFQLYQSKMHLRLRQWGKVTSFPSKNEKAKTWEKHQPWRSSFMKMVFTNKKKNVKAKNLCFRFQIDLKLTRKGPVPGSCQMFAFFRVTQHPLKHLCTHFLLWHDSGLKKLGGDFCWHKLASYMAMEFFQRLFQ